MNHKEDLELISELIGHTCERTLACNSIKLRFGCEVDPRGTSYIWIDAPWELQTETELVTESLDYPAEDEEFKNWSNKLNPLNKTVLVSVIFTKGKDLQLEFEGGYYLYVPYSPNEPDDDDWYEHWYARKK
ncbi:hypothetical protein BTA51_26810 [Hahella sp. CCB-MM4]|uniref:hypothetical protein n=1 Tax=Hahella sp. (strain CCB-MM4) TaxID=1926491 RepID=UPI000B9BED52|nr:hypothetical protein [Hahella sp. CCB-MM4]OZG70329.1 hypothetical protein BTA51_26810 [Hahella sp. CCB-MM4]